MTTGVSQPTAFATIDLLRSKMRWTEHSNASMLANLMSDTDEKPPAPVAPSLIVSTDGTPFVLPRTAAPEPTPKTSLFQLVGIEQDPEPAPAPAPAESPYGPPVHDPGAFIGVPVMFMKGGTTSSKYDRDMAEMRQDAAKRQSEDAAERRQSVKMPEKAKGDEAAAKALRESVIGSAIAADKGISYNHDMAGRAPVCIIEIRSKDNAHHMFCQADLVVVEADGRPIPALIVVCPRCVERGVDQKFAQLTLRQDNRKWYLDEKWKGQTWVDPITNEPFLIAGVVELPERAVCTNTKCDFAFRINGNNKEHPMTSLMMAE